MTYNFSSCFIFSLFIINILSLYYIYINFTQFIINFFSWYRFPYTNLVTTSHQLSNLHSIIEYTMIFSHSTLRPIFVPTQLPSAWRAVCTKPQCIFTVPYWYTITNDSSFMLTSFSQQSVLRKPFLINSYLHNCHIL